MKEAFCNYETAKLLKEKGFSGEMNHFISHHNNDGTSEAIATCTHQMAMAWLREAHNIFIEIIIFRENMIHYRFKILNRNCEKIYIDDGSQFSYEEAVEAALKYVLENLI